MNNTLDTILERARSCKDPKCEIDNKKVAELKHAIISHIKGKMPEKKDWPDNQNTADHTAVAAFNQCLDQVNKILKELEK